MYCYKCAIFRERKNSRFKTIYQREAIIYKVIQFVVALLLMSLMYKRYNICKILKTYSYSMNKHFLHN